MRLICPHCHSSNVTSNTDADSPFAIVEQLCSQATLSALCSSVCKYYKVNPALGVIVGTALASAIHLAKDKILKPPLLIVATPYRRYLCHTCSNTFT